MKKLIITESQFKFITEKLISEAQQGPVVNVTYKFQSTYAANSSDPSAFLTQFVEGLVQKIKQVPNGDAMLKRREMMLDTIIVTAGASNSWGGKTTPYDRENDYVSFPKTPQDTSNQLYTLNSELSKKRAETFRKFLGVEIAKRGIKDNPSANSTYYSLVINTGGKIDKERNQASFANPGQYIEVKMRFKYQSEIVKSGMTANIVSTNQIRTYTDIKPNMLLTGSYYCNGKNSQGGGTGSQDLKGAMAEMCAGVGGVKDTNAKYAMAFEIKWNVNVLKDPYTEPIIRWMFHFNQNGKIDKITKYVYNKEYYFLRAAVPQSQVSVSDPEMKYYMGIREGKPQTGGSFYAKYIQPYI